LRRMAPPDDGVVADVSLTTLAGLKADDASEEAEAHGEGSGLSGEIMDAEDDRVETAPVFRPPKTGILRISNEDGLRNSEGRRCRGGLYVSFDILIQLRGNDSFDFVNRPELLTSRSALPLSITYPFLSAD
jgi:hypothetical protein